ncbi:hypothetical protein Csa_016602 [Cucumis sativus]|nr:hypothetical protein Csa_016602 [Cucumis sativus]
MAVHPWEIPFLDINLRDGVIIRENGSSEGKTKKLLPRSDGCGSSSSTKSAGTVEMSSAQVQKLKHKLAPERPFEDVKPKVDTGLKSHSHPKERSTPFVKSAKKRLALSNNDPGSQNQTVRNSTGKATMTKSINDKPKSISRSSDTKSEKPKSHN